MSVRTVPHDRLRIDAEPLTRHLVAFLADTARRLGTEALILPVSGGVDSATVAHLATRALGPERVVVIVARRRYAPRRQAAGLPRCRRDDLRGHPWSSVGQCCPTKVPF